MRVEGGATCVSWIPSEAVTGIVYRLPFDMSVAHYDDPPPDTLPDIGEYLAADRARFVNRLQAWIEVENGDIVDFGHTGGGRIGATTLRLGSRRMTFLACPLPDLRRSERIGADAVRFEQTAGGRTGVPAPRRVAVAPYAQFVAPLAWSTVAVTLYADGRCSHELAGASPFPRHWLYGPDRRLSHKTAVVEYQRWSRTSFGKHSPWGDADSPALTREVESALEREMSRLIMRGGRRPQLRRLHTGERLTVQHERGTELFLLLDGILRVDIDGQAVAEVAPGAVLGERALLEGGVRTATLEALTPCLVAVAPPDAHDEDALRRLATTHHREDVTTPASPGNGER
jgi:hypothetical protein